MNYRGLYFYLIFFLKSRKGNFFCAWYVRLMKTIGSVCLAWIICLFYHYMPQFNLWKDTHLKILCHFQNLHFKTHAKLFYLDFFILRTMCNYAIRSLQNKAYMSNDNSFWNILSQNSPFFRINFLVWEVMYQVHYISVNNAEKYEV